MDPRLKTEAEGLNQQFELEQRLAEAVTRSSESLLQARSIEEQLEALPQQQKASPATRALIDFRRQVKGIIEDRKGTDSNQAQGLDSANTDVISLYKDVDRADARPTLAQTQASRRVLNRLTELLEQWESLKRGLPGLNRQLPPGSEPLRLGKLPSQIEKGQDEE
jgi:hypothetical protein